jgi:hypothetical protein
MLNRLKTHFATFLKKEDNDPSKIVRSRLTFETLQAMAQVYHERQQEVPVMPTTIETMAWAYTQACRGEDPWIALGNFTNAWYGYAKHIRADMVSEPLTRPEQQTEHTHRWAAFCTASVEFLCERYDIACPDLVHDPSFILETDLGPLLGGKRKEIEGTPRKRVNLTLLTRRVHAERRVSL